MTEVAATLSWQQFPYEITDLGKRRALQSCGDYDQEREVNVFSITAENIFIQWLQRTSILTTFYGQARPFLNIHSAHTISGTPPRPSHCSRRSDSKADGQSPAQTHHAGRYRTAVDPGTILDYFPPRLSPSSSG